MAVAYVERVDAIRQVSPAGSGADPAAAWHGSAGRFLLLTVVGTAADFAAAGWLYESPLLCHAVAAGWQQPAPASWRSLGCQPQAAGNVVYTPHGAFIVRSRSAVLPTEG